MDSKKKSDEPYRVLALPKYGRLSANMRYRLEQYLPALHEAGIEVTIQSAFDDCYLIEKFRTGKVKLSSVLIGFLGRFKAILTASRYDSVLIFSEGYPYFPLLFEKWLSLIGVPYIYDFDDAEFHRYDLHKNSLIRALLGSKISKVIAHASHVFAGNTYLADYAKKYNSRVTIIPTVVDTDRYFKPRVFSEKTNGLQIGWVGSPSTTQYLVPISEVLSTYCREFEGSVIAVGASASFKLPDTKLRVLPWAEKTEVEDILSFDIGIMPLIDDPWSRGKCGFKLIQYMACGIPVIASPVGVNSEIITHGVDGFLAHTSEEWQAALKLLTQDPVLRRVMGEAGRKKVLEKYSLQSTGRIFTARLRETFKSYSAPKL